MEEINSHARRYLNTVEGEPIVDRNSDGSETYYVRVPHLQIIPDDLADLIAQRHGAKNFGKGGPRPNLRRDILWNRRQFVPSGILLCSGCHRPLGLNQETYGCKSYSHGITCTDPNFVPHKSIDRVIIQALKRAFEGEWEGAEEKYKTFRLRLASKDPEAPEKRRAELNSKLKAANTDLDDKIEAVGRMKDDQVIALMEKRLAALLAYIEELEAELDGLDEKPKSNDLDSGQLKLMALNEAFGWLEDKLPLRPNDAKTNGIFEAICAMVPMVRLERIKNRHFIAHVTIQPDGVFEEPDPDLAFEIALPFENDPIARTSSKRTGERSSLASTLMSEDDYTFSEEELEVFAQLAPVQRHYRGESLATLARVLPCFYFSATNDFTFSEALVATGIPKRTYLYCQAMSVRNDIDVHLLLDAIQELRPSHTGRMHIYKRESRVQLTPRQVLEAVNHPVLSLAAFAPELRNAPLAPSIEEMDAGTGFTLTGAKKKGRPRAYFVLQSFITAVRMSVSIAEICGQHDNRCTPNLKALMERGVADELVRRIAISENAAWPSDVPSLWQTLYVGQGKAKHRQRAGVKKRLQDS